MKKATLFENHVEFHFEGKLFFFYAGKNILNILYAVDVLHTKFTKSDTHSLFNFALFSYKFDFRFRF